ncbi:Protein kinase-like domain protein [Beauveria brongniartii RCEF 3172]|uniref:Protein kinase-like domain protein n=1 Tax=Beauveria brongniartii RCEF 3172 TaxID=1081107 RepID=A0A167DX54_9HYPO|nr:Protein kinase-like domain protein [Beauveria brongniartii RCEF 3172]
MQYVAAHTSIPIPKLNKIHTTGSGHIYIEMEYVQGDTLFLPKMTAGDKASVLGQLRRYVEELRALPPPSPGFVSSAFGNPAHDGRIGGRFFGPMSSRS